MSMQGGGNTATFYITGNAQGATNAAAQANNALAQLSQTVANNWWGVQNLGLAFAALPSAVLAGAGVAINAAIEWEDAMFALERTTGETGETVRSIGDDILEVARRVPLATSELANLAATGAQLGIANENLGQFSETMGILLSATNLTEANVQDFARVLNVLRVPAEDMDNFANTLLEVGRNTAATESEILNMSKRISGAAGVAGFAAAEVLGLSAAVLSLGPRAEAGGTAINKTITDMTKAVANGGDELETFAAVANVSMDEFKQIFREDAAQAVARFVTGLARLRGGGEDQIRVLEDLGITEQRQMSALQQLAQGTLDVGNEQRDLNAILGFANNSWQNSNALQDIADAKAKTLSGQLQILRNAVFEFGQAIGSFLIGPIGFFVQRIIDFLVGIQALPAPLRIAFAALLLFITGLSGIAAAALLIGPRLLIAYDAFLRIQSGAGLAAGGISQATVAANLSTVAITRMGAAYSVATRQMAVGSTSQQVAQNMANIRNGVGGITLGFTKVGPAAINAGVGVSRFAGIVGKLGKVAGWAGAALSILSVVAVFVGNKQREEAAAAQQAVEANADLVAVMRNSGEVAGEAALAWLRASPAYLEAAESARRLGFDLSVLEAIIKGSAAPDQMQSLVDTIKNGGEAGQNFGRQVLALAQVFQASATASNVNNVAIDEGIDAQNESAEAAKKNSDALKEQIRILEGMAQAHIDLADAVVGIADAQDALEDAQQAYSDALSESLDNTLALKRAELDLASARMDEARAQRDLVQLETKLAEARSQGQQRTVEVTRDLADANDSYLDSLDTVAELEEELAQLRLGPASDAARDAVNELRNAELKLARAHQTVADAEWNLQHLREEGASDRDISDAEMALAESRQEVADSEADLADKTKELNDIRDTGKQAEAIADAERNLASAVRDSQRALEDIGEAAQALADARSRQAADTDYLEAQEDLLAGQIAVEEAIQRTKDAELELAEVRDGRATADAAAAALELQTAIIRMAQANADVRRQQALANGETWDAGDAAHALADELSALLGLSPNAQVTQNLQNYIDTLYSAPNVPDAPRDADTGTNIEFDPTDYGLPQISDISAYMDELQNALNGGGEKKSLKDQIFDSLGGGAGTGAAIGGLLGMILGPPGAIVGAFVGAIVGGLTEKFRPEIVNFFTSVGSSISGLAEESWASISGLFTNFGWDTLLGSAGGDLIRGLGSGIWQALQSFWQPIGDGLYTLFVAPFKAMFGIASPSTLFAGFGADIIRGLLNGFLSLVESIWNFFAPIGGRIIGYFSDAGMWLFNKGGDLIRGFVGGIQSIAGTLWDFFVQLPGKIWNTFTGVATWLFNIGGELVRGLVNGMTDFITNNPISNWFEDHVGGPLARLLPGSPVREGSLRVLNGGYAGAQIMKMLGEGMDSQVSNLAATMRNVTGTISDELARDYLVGSLNPAAARSSFAAATGGAMGGTGTIVNNNETLNLEAITTADPAEVVNQYVWQKRVRLRGGVNA